MTPTAYPRAADWLFTGDETGNGRREISSGSVDRSSEDEPAENRARDFLCTPSNSTSITAEIGQSQQGLPSS